MQRNLQCALNVCTRSTRPRWCRATVGNQCWRTGAIRGRVSVCRAGGSSCDDGDACTTGRRVPEASAPDRRGLCRRESLHGRLVRPDGLRLRAERGGLRRRQRLYDRRSLPRRFLRVHGHAGLLGRKHLHGRHVRSCDGLRLPAQRGAVRRRRRVHEPRRLLGRGVYRNGPALVVPRRRRRRLRRRSRFRVRRLRAARLCGQSGRLLRHRLPGQPRERRSSQWASPAAAFRANFICCDGRNEQRLHRSRLMRRRRQLRPRGGWTEDAVPACGASATFLTSCRSMMGSCTSDRRPRPGMPVGSRRTRTGQEVRMKRLLVTGGSSGRPLGAGCDGDGTGGRSGKTIADWTADGVDPVVRCVARR